MQKLPTKLRIVYITIIIIVSFSAASKLFFTPKSAYSAQGILHQINFQGKLTNPDGTNVTDGNFDMVFKIYSAASGGSPIWTETRTGGNQVAVKAGIFRVSLGSVQALPGSIDFNTDNIYLGITVGADSEMTPRVQFTSVPQAFNAEKVNGLTVTNTSNNPFSTATVLKIGDGKTVIINNTMTFSGTDSTAFTFPASSGNIVSEDFTQTLTNKTVGSTGLTFSGATTDVTTVGNEDFSLVPNGSGKININTTSGLASVDIRANAVAGGTLAVASVSGTTSFAAFLVDNRGAGDILTASTGGVTKFTVNNNGQIYTSNYKNNGGIIYTTTSGVLGQTAVGNNGECLQSIGGGTPVWGSCGGGGGNNWWTLNSANGNIYAGNQTVDLFVGGSSTSSAKFAVLNIAGGTPTASVSATATGTGLSLGGDGTIQSLRNSTLTIGGATTGNVMFSPTGIVQLANNGAANKPPLTLTGTWFTGGSATTTKPQLLVEPAGTTSTGWATGGTGIGINAASGFAGYLFDAQVAGSSVMHVGSDGTIYVGAGSADCNANCYGPGNVNSGGDLTLTAHNSGNVVLLTDAGSSVFVERGFTGPNVVTLSTNGTIMQTNYSTSGTFHNINSSTITQAGAILGITVDTSSSVTVPNSASGNQIGLQLTTKDGGATALARGIVFLGTADYGIDLRNLTATTSALFGNGFISIGNTNLAPAAPLDIRSGNQGGNAAFILSQTGNSANDIFTASSGATTKFTVANNGNIVASGVLSGLTGLTLAGGPITLGGVTGSGLCITGGATAAWGSCGTGGGGDNWWHIDSTSGVLYPGNLTTDFLLGGTASLSAKFAVLGLAEGSSPTASVSATSGANSGKGIVLGGDGSIQSLKSSTLTIGGNTTGDVYIRPLNSTGMVRIIHGNTGAGGLMLGDFETDATNKTGRIKSYAYNSATSLPITMILASNQATTNQLHIGGGSGTEYAATELFLKTAANITTTVGTTRLYVKSDGFIGIGDGNTTPVARLDIKDEATDINGVKLALRRTGAGDVGISFQQNGTSAFGIVNRSGAGNGLAFVDNYYEGSNGTEIARFYASSGVGIGTLGSLPLATLDVKGAFTNSGTQPIASFSAKTSFAGLVVDNTGLGDIFAASTGGVTKFVVNNSGQIYTSNYKNNGGLLYTQTNGIVAQTAVGNNGECLQSVGGGTPVWGSCGTGGGGNNWWTLDTANGVLYPGNLTAGLLIGGNSTASAAFAFASANGVPTATFSGNLVMNSRPNSSLAQQQTWTKISGTAGTIGDNATTNIASVSASVLYNGSLYVGTATNNSQAEVYRYDGSVLGTWTKVSQSTAGQIASGGTSGIASVSAMTVFDGYLYIGTSKQSNPGNNSGAEVYRYDGGTNWTKVTQANAGTIRSGGTADIDGVSSLAVYGGRMYAGTREPAKAELYRYDGGTTWTSINTTAGTFVATNSVAINAITSMVTSNGFLYMGTAKAGDADVIRWSGGAGATNANFLSMNAAGATGSYSINGTASTANSEVTAMATYNGSLIIGINKNAGATAEVLSLNVGPQSGTTSPDSWQRLGAATGQLNTGGTSAIDAIGALAVYNGRLYAGTSEPGNAEIYRYDGIGRWTKVSQTTVGQIAAGGTSGIFGVTVLLSDDVLYAMTSNYNTGKAEVYTYQAYLDQSYSLTFRATPGLVGGLQNSQMQEGSIFFLASSSAIANNKAGTNGAFAFTNSIVTRNGAYDVAEDYPTRDDTLEPGDLVSIDTNERGLVRKSEGSKDTAIIGVYSQNPALRLSQNDGALGSFKVIPVALAGRVPLKVSTENGVIKSGDYLTSSSIPGVAMKATKAGVTVARAMAPYDGDGVGNITVYVSSNSYNGTTADLLANIDQTKPNFEQDILAKLSQNNADGLVSEINTDRLVAGLEIITPKIVADTGIFNIANIRDATISGTLTADTIKANKIEGLEFIIGDAMTPAAAASDFQFKILDSKLASISAKIEKLENLPQVNFTSVATNSGELFTTANNLMVLGTTTLSDLSVISNFSIGNSLSISGSSINVVGSDLALQPLKQGNINLFDGLITFDTDGNIFASGSARFAGDVTVGGVLSAQTAKFEDINLKHSDVKIISDTEVEASGSSGLVVLKAGNNNLKVDNAQVKKNSLIFITAKTEIGTPLYIKEQDEGWFTVGIKENQNLNVDFNFLIIN